jgi:hypothetical protein
VFSDSPVDIKFICGVVSTTITGPELISNSTSAPSYIMVIPESLYTIGIFKVSNPACPVNKIEVVPIDGSSANEYTSTSSSKVSTFSELPGSETTAVIPPSRIFKQEYKFRIKATAEGLNFGFSDNILVSLINCDSRGPILRGDITPFEIRQMSDRRTKFKTVDVSSFFKPLDIRCPINGFKVSKVANKKTKAVVTVDFVSIDKGGLLKIENFATLIETSYIYVEACAGEIPTCGTDSSYVGSLEIYPKPIN